MAAPKKIYRCSNCAHTEIKWFSSCPVCGNIGTAESATATVTSTASSSSSKGVRESKAATDNKIQKIGEIKKDTYRRISTGIGELDRVLGGGLVPGGVILLAGEPGAGKSTLSLLAAKTVADTGLDVLIVSGEETAAQIASRAERTNGISDNLSLLAESSLTNVISQVEAAQPDFLIVDSIQTLVSGNSDGRPGSPAQVAEVANDITRLAKINNFPCILIGHISRSGDIAGPKQVEHLVDVVLYFEGDRDSNLRILRAKKSRYGASDEIGVFEHSEDGLQEVSDPSGFFLNEHEAGITGYASSILVEGNRALPIELQALVTPTKLPNPRKISTGLDHARSQMIQAVLDKHGRQSLSYKDVYVATSGGFTTKDSSVDLAVAAALISSSCNLAIPEGTVFLGEVSLTGEIRPPREMNKRVNEAKRLGFKKIVVPRGGPGTIPVTNVVGLISWLKENGIKEAFSAVDEDDDE